MGGEQYAMLMYGPNREYDIQHLIIEKFKLINKKEWVKNFMLNEKHTYEDPYDSDDSEGIDIVFSQEFNEYNAFKLLEKFLANYGLILVFNNNICWDTPLIGIQVKDYNQFNESQMKKVQEFCKKYNLEEPTFYAGIIGEYE